MLLIKTGCARRGHKQKAALNGARNKTKADRKISRGKDLKEGWGMQWRTRA